MTSVAFPRIEELGDGPSPATMTGTSFDCPTPVGESVPLPGLGLVTDPGLGDDLTDTTRGAVGTKLGIGAVVALSHCTSEATELRANDGVIDCIV